MSIEVNRRRAVRFPTRPGATKEGESMHYKDVFLGCQLWRLLILIAWSLQVGCQQQLLRHLLSVCWAGDCLSQAPQKFMLGLGQPPKNVCWAGNCRATGSPKQALLCAKAMCK